MTDKKPRNEVIPDIQDCTETYASDIRGIDGYIPYFSPRVAEARELATKMAQALLEEGWETVKSRAESLITEIEGKPNYEAVAGAHFVARVFELAEQAQLAGSIGVNVLPELIEFDRETGALDVETIQTNLNKFGFAFIHREDRGTLVCRRTPAAGSTNNQPYEIVNLETLWEHAPEQFTKIVSSYMVETALPHIASEIEQLHEAHNMEFDKVLPPSMKRFLNATAELPHDQIAMSLDRLHMLLSMYANSAQGRGTFSSLYGAIDYYQSIEFEGDTPQTTTTEPIDLIAYLEHMAECGSVAEAQKDQATTALMFAELFISGYGPNAVSGHPDARVREAGSVVEQLEHTAHHLDEHDVPALERGIESLRELLTWLKEDPNAHDLNSRVYRIYMEEVPKFKYSGVGVQLRHLALGKYEDGGVATLEQIIAKQEEKLQEQRDGQAELIERLQQNGVSVETINAVKARIREYDDLYDLSGFARDSLALWLTYVASVNALLDLQIEDKVLNAVTEALFSQKEASARVA